MTVNEVASFLNYSKEKVKAAITKGVELPISRKLIKLKSSKSGKHIDISETSLNKFVNAFEAEEPGRHPPMEIRRTLLVEARERCAICRQPLPLQFHHMLDWSKIKHHDPKHMLAICGGCHSLCTIGQIDYQRQVMYKAQMLGEIAPKEKATENSNRKLEKDIRTLTELYSVFPRSMVNEYLEQAQWDKIIIDVQDAMETSENIIASSMFHLYDKELWRLLKEFFADWRILTDLAPYIYHDHRGSGIATATNNMHAIAQDYENHEKFMKHVAQARHGLFLLNCYIYDEYPSFNQDDLDKHAVSEWIKLSDRIEREMEERLNNRKKVQRSKLPKK